MSTAPPELPIDDAASQLARETILGAFYPGFQSLGDILWVAGCLIGGDRVSGQSPFGYGSDLTVGIGIVAQTAAALCEGMMTLLSQGNSYASAALLRQLVEVEYLAWAFAEDHEEAAAWLRSTRNERLARWQPRHLRKRSDGRFRGIDYALHCELGGHPTSRGAKLLRGHQGIPSWMLQIDMALHGASIYDYLVAATEGSGQQIALAQAPFVTLGECVQQWRANDRLRTGAEDWLRRAAG